MYRLTDSLNRCFISSSFSLDAIEPTGLTIRAVTQELVACSVPAPGAHEPERPSPGVFRHALQMRFFARRFERRRATPVVIGEVAVDDAPRPEQRRARLPNPRRTSLAD